jgi:hypothetical protein
VSDNAVLTPTVETTTPSTETTAPSEPPPAQPNGDATPSSLLSEAAATEAAAETPPPEPFDVEKITIPEGMTKADALFTKFTDVAKEHGLSGPVAQTLIDLAAEQVQATVQKQSAEWAKQQEDWQAQVRSDPTIGGDKLQENLATFSGFVKGSGLCAPGFLEALAFSGMGNHPAVVKTLVQVARAFSEGGPIQGGPANSSNEPRNWGEVFYGRKSS